MLLIWWDRNRVTRGVGGLGVAVQWIPAGDSSGGFRGPGYSQLIFAAMAGWPLLIEWGREDE